MNKRTFLISVFLFFMILIPVTINSAGNSNIGYLDTTNSSGFYEDVVVGTNHVYLA